MANIKCFIFVAAAVGLALGTATPATAQKDLPLEPGQIWTHRHSGIDVPTQIGGLSRIVGKQVAEAQLSVLIVFGNKQAGELAAFHIFRNTGGSAPVWLAQAQRRIEADTVAGTAALEVAPRAFTPPRQSRATGVLAAYALTDKSFASTGLAVFPVGDWYVKLEATSATRSPEQNIAWMNDLVSALRLPPSDGEPSATPVVPCVTPLKFHASSRSPVESGAGISQAAGRMTAAQWCRDKSLSDSVAAYRPADTNDRYLLAISDFGSALSVQSQGQYYSVNYLKEGVTLALPPQTALPDPVDVLVLADGNEAMHAFVTWPPR